MAICDNDTLVAMLRSDETRERGFRILIKQYSDTLYWHIRRIVVSHEDAEDVMQETIINIYKNIDKFQGKSSLATWIYRIATNEAIRLLQSHCKLFQSVDTLSESLCNSLSTENEIDEKAIKIVFQKAILQLPLQQRLAFNMRYYDEMPYEQIAQITGKNINTLKTNYHFAVEKIKKYIKDYSI
ncbi:MAG: sigma-70 family RNA polymerase sigma factor [Muribaculaceae bacterium]